MIPHQQIASHVAAYPEVFSNRPFPDPISVYWLPADPDPVMFAVLSDHSIPRLSLRCDSALMLRLRDKYGTVGPGQKLNRKIWNTILLTGQLSWEEIIGLVDHSYQLALASCQVDTNEIPDSVKAN